MDQFLDGSPLGVKMLVYYGSVFAGFLFLYAIPLSVLQWMAKTRWLNANCWTIYRVPLFWVGAPIWLICHSYEGFATLAASLLLDFFDGRVAKAQALLNDPKYPGITEKGKVLDPGADKACVPPLMTLLAFTGLYSIIPCLVMDVFEVAGTLIRWPFIGLDVWPFKRIKDRIRCGDATGVGKVKMALQCATMALTVPYTKGWWDSSTQWMTWVIWGLVVLAAASPASRVRFHKVVDEHVDNFTRPFNRVNGFLAFLSLKKTGVKGTGTATIDNGRKP